MDYFYFDHRGNNSALPWLEELVTLISDGNCSLMRSAPSQPRGKWICFAHTGVGTRQTQRDFETATAPRARFVVLVSSHFLTQQSKCDQVHCLCHPLESVHAHLNNNPEILKRFQQSCDAGAPEWHLLTPHSLTETLVAAYLLRLAQKRGVQVDETKLPEQFTDKVSEEYLKLTGQVAAWPDLTKEDIASAFSAIR